MSALSDRSLVQSVASKAVEVWAQTLLEDLTGVTVDDPSWLVTFHGGTVELLQEPPARYSWPSDFGMAVWPTVWPGELPQIGQSEFPLAIRTAAYYRESLETRQAGEAGLEDLIFYLSAAALSQRELTWKTEFSASPPAGIPLATAITGRRLAISPVVFERFYDDDADCSGVEAFLDAMWALEIQTC